MRRLLIAGNWKMHKSVAETTAYFEALIAEDVPTTVDVLCCPPFTALPAAAMIATGSAVHIGAQNVHWETTGAFTGEIAAPMLGEIGIGWVIVGHSERRTLFGETDATALARAKAAQGAGRRHWVCVPDQLQRRLPRRLAGGQLVDGMLEELGALRFVQLGGVRFEDAQDHSGTVLVIDFGERRYQFGHGVLATFKSAGC